MVAAAGLTDFADGFIARRFKLTSWAGGLLDGVADKAFTLSALYCLTREGILEPWLAPLLLTRDLAVLFIAGYAASTRKWYAFRLMPARWPGKFTTACMFVSLLAVTGLEHGTPWVNLLLGLTAGCSLLAAADYLRLFASGLKAEKTSGSTP